jgi:hypothetical protein
MDGTIIEPTIEENMFSSCYAAIFTRQSSWAVTLARPVYFGTEATPLSSRRGEKKENDSMGIKVLIEML